MLSSKNGFDFVDIGDGDFGENVFGERFWKIEFE